MLRKVSTRVTLAAITTMSVAGQAFALDKIGEGAGDAKPSGANGNLFKSVDGQQSLFQLISNTLIYLIGAISVIMLIIGGFRYVVSQGSSDQVKQAKDTILYAIIGIIVAILAYAIVNFVITSFK